MKALLHSATAGALPVLALLTMASACFAGPEARSPSCTRDEDCPEICSRVGECLALDEVIEIRASWTIGGQSPTPSAPGSCGAIDSLEIGLETGDARDEPIVYYPVPCELGQVYYDRMSNRLTRMRLSSVAADGSVFEVAFINIGGASTDAQVDFIPQ